MVEGNSQLELGGLEAHVSTREKGTVYSYGMRLETMWLRNHYEFHTVLPQANYREIFVCVSSLYSNR